jgi:hypothetical protein
VPHLKDKGSNPQDEKSIPSVFVTCTGYNICKQYSEMLTCKLFLNNAVFNIKVET